MTTVLAVLLLQAVTSTDLPTEPVPVKVLQGHAAVIKLDPSACAAPITLFKLTWHCRPDNKLILGVPVDAQPTEYRLSPEVTIAVQKVPWIAQHYPEVKTTPAPLVRQTEDQLAKEVAYHTHDQRPWSEYHMLPIFLHPLPWGEGLTEIFGVQRYYGKSENPHPHIGVDIAARRGTPVFAAGSGRVVLAQALWNEGNTVIIYHGDAVYTAYCHLDTMIDPKKTPMVHGIEVIGTVGGSSEARALGPHLHFVVRINGVPVDPLDALAVLDSLMTVGAK